MRAHVQTVLGVGILGQAHTINMRRALCVTLSLHLSLHSSAFAPCLCLLSLVLLLTVAVCRVLQFALLFPASLLLVYALEGGAGLR